MNIIWTIVTVLSLAVVTSHSPNKTLSLCVDSATQAIKFAFELCAVYSLWLGVFEVANRCNLTQKLSKLLSKVNVFLYGKVEDVAQSHLSLNMASNLLGVGNAATPSAIEALKVTEKGEKISKAGAMLFVLNANGIQIVPTTVIGLRASLGSVNAGDILLPTVICTLATAILGIALVNIAFGGKQ